jgi:glycosyltransferase involved in cell wall biosynthesis
LKIPVRLKIIRESLASAPAIITRSAELGRLLREAGVAGEKLHTVYNGIDFATFKPEARAAARNELGLPPDGPVLLFVGNFLPVKNPLLLVDAHAELCRRQQVPKCQLVMVGGGPMEPEIRARAASGGFAGQVVLAGRKQSGEVARYMQAADLLCLPSENEGVPNVILEAFASGLRVVASRVGGIPEVLCQDALGRLFVRGNRQELQSAIAELLAEPPQTDTIRNHALHFSWERASGHYTEILKSISFK